MHRTLLPRPQRLHHARRLRPDAAQAVHQANSDGSSSGSATAPMPISMEPSEDDQANDARLSMGDWALVFVALTSGIASITMLAGYALVKLS